MHLQARHVGHISTINPDTPTNLAAAGRATTSPNINNPQRSKVEWYEKGKICAGFASQPNEQETFDSKKACVCSSIET